MRRAVAGAVVALLLSGNAFGRELAGGGEEGGEAWLTLRSALHGSTLIFRAPEDPLLFPETVSGTSFWRLRFEPEAKPTAWLTLSLAYEQSLLTGSSSTGLGATGFGVLPSEARAPYRVTPLEGTIAGDGTRLAWRQGLDRAFVKAHHPIADLTVGRQAIGWGRGVLFNAVDLFPPFTPLEYDREWRRGVDAIRVETAFSEHASMDTVAAFGERLEESVYAARLRGYLGKVDAELVGGWRAGDWVVGASASAAVGGMELHGELATFYLPEPWYEPELFDNPRWVPKAVLGGSYQIGVAGGIRLLAEYHYSGFGISRPDELLERLADPAIQKRYLRGDTQILGRHALALVASWQALPTLGVSATWLQDPVDGSGLAAPTLNWDFSEKVTLIGGVYASYGRRPVALSVGSQFGYVPLTGIVQVRIYD